MAEDCFESHLTNVLPFAFIASERILNQAVKVLIRYINKLFENVHKTGRERVDVCLFFQNDGYYGDGDGKNIRVDVCLSFSAPPTQMSVTHLSHLRLGKNI